MFIFSSSNPFYAYADKHDLCSKFDACLEQTQKPEPLAIITCKNSPSKWHEAIFKNRGSLYRGSQSGSNSVVYDYGNVWQCEYCCEVIITQGWGQTAIGYYATYNPGENLYGSYTNVYSNNIQYTSKGKVEGFNLRFP
ncbi:MAG: hypothetical protein RSB70_04205 [Clostridium sp.]